MNHFKKEDIQNHFLVIWLCRDNNYSAINKFQFFFELDPSSLLQSNNSDGKLPLHFVAKNLSTKAFKSVFTYCVLYYPVKKGICLLFTKDNSGRTPFQIVCDKYECLQVMEIVEEILVTHCNNSGNEIRLNIANALLLSCIDDRIHLD